MEQDPDPNPLFHETDPRIRINIKMKQIRNTGILTVGVKHPIDDLEPENKPRPGENSDRIRTPKVWKQKKMLPKLLFIQWCINYRALYPDLAKTGSASVVFGLKTGGVRIRSQPPWSYKNLNLTVC